MDPGGRGATWRLAGVGIALAVAGTAAPAVTAAPRAREIRVLEVKGVINPLSARYLARELGAARDAALFVVELDTPGGLDSSMRAMTQAILGSPTVLAALDRIEGHRPAEPERSLYNRVRVRATLDDGRTEDVWVYFYNAPLGRAPRITSGDYVEHLKNR